MTTRTYFATHGVVYMVSCLLSLVSGLWSLVVHLHTKHSAEPITNNQSPITNHSLTVSRLSSLVSRLWSFTGIQSTRPNPSPITNHQSPITNLNPLTILLITFLLSACNPFAPALEEGDPFATLLGDPTTIDGFFTNFQTAYELRDISLYEPLLDSTFTFSYYDFDVQVEKQWNFSQEIESTRRLFENTSLIRLQWNQIISQNLFSDSLQARVVRSFNLTINLETGDVFRGDGNVNFVISRDAEGQPWQLLTWRDESEF